MGKTWKYKPDENNNHHDYLEYRKKRKSYIIEVEEVEQDAYEKEEDSERLPVTKE